MLGIVGSAVWGLVSNKVPLTGDNLAQAVVPKLFLDWWHHYPVLVAIGAAFAAELLTVVVIVAERANDLLQTAKKVEALREKFKAWQQMDADAVAAHERWLKIHRRVQDLEHHPRPAGEQPPGLSGPPFDLGVLPLLDRFVGREEDIQRLMVC